VIVASLLSFPVSSARADDDDDWDDDVEDYYEELEDRREEARERWEDWHDDREDALEDWYEHHGRYDGPRYRAYRPVVPRYEYYDDFGGRVYYSHPAPQHGYYESYPQPRYYGTNRVGYSEFGRERAVQFGPVHVYWTR
jgi:hypothetical protein